jgi:hypothetical protein
MLTCVGQRSAVAVEGRSGHPTSGIKRCGQAQYLDIVINNGRVIHFQSILNAVRGIGIADEKMAVSSGGVEDDLPNLSGRDGASISHPWHLIRCLPRDLVRTTRRTGRGPNVLLVDDQPARLLNYESIRSRQ